MYLLHWQCKKAVDVGRANRAGFADIGKAYSRMAKASSKMGDKQQAIAYLEDAQVMSNVQSLVLTAGFVNVCRRGRAGRVVFEVTLREFCDAARPSTKLERREPLSFLRM